MATEGDGDAKPGTALVTRQGFTGSGILAAALGRAMRPADGSVPDGAREQPLPTEVRRIRRGKFFLSRHEQTTFGSMRKPIFEYYCHGVVVGETVPDEDRDGIWCYAAHNDFDLIAEFQPPSSWPEYVRTPTGWIRGSRFDGVIDPTNLINLIHNQKRLK